MGRGLKPAADVELCNFLLILTVSALTLETSELNIEMELVGNNDEAIKRTTIMAAFKKKKTEMMHFDF